MERFIKLETELIKKDKMIKIIDNTEITSESKEGLKKLIENKITNEFKELSLTDHLCKIAGLRNFSTNVYIFYESVLNQGIKENYITSDEKGNILMELTNLLYNQ